MLLSRAVNIYITLNLITPCPRVEMKRRSNISFLLHDLYDPAPKDMKFKTLVELYLKIERIKKKNNAFSKYNYFVWPRATITTLPRGHAIYDLGRLCI